MTFVLICLIRNFPPLQADIRPWNKLKTTIQKCSSTRCRDNLGVICFTSNPTSQISKGFWDLTYMAIHWTQLKSNQTSWKVSLVWYNTLLNVIVKTTQTPKVCIFQYMFCSHGFAGNILSNCFSLLKKLCL